MEGLLVLINGLLELFQDPVLNSWSNSSPGTDVLMSAASKDSNIGWPTYRGCKDSSGDSPDILFW